jgi:hypothetical protein
MVKSAKHIFVFLGISGFESSTLVEVKLLHWVKDTSYVVDHSPMAVSTSIILRQLSMSSNHSFSKL